jgi:photosystem II stability/assembly factor-like uncharacterized protein
VGVQFEESARHAEHEQGVVLAISDQRNTQHELGAKGPPYNSSRVRGSGFAAHPVSASTFYCLVADSVLQTRDSGETWSLIAKVPSAYDRANAFVVSPKDTNTWLAAVASGSGTPDAVIRTTDAGANWTTVLTHDFGVYGVPSRNGSRSPRHGLFRWRGANGRRLPGQSARLV